MKQLRSPFQLRARSSDLTIIVIRLSSRPLLFGFSPAREAFRPISARTKHGGSACALIGRMPVTLGARGRFGVRLTPPGGLRAGFGPSERSGCDLLPPSEASRSAASLGDVKREAEVGPEGRSGSGAGRAACAPSRPLPPRRARGPSLALRCGRARALLAAAVVVNEWRLMLGVVGVAPTHSPRAPETCQIHPVSRHVYSNVRRRRV